MNVQSDHLVNNLIKAPDIQQMKTLRTEVIQRVEPSQLPPFRPHRDQFQATSGRLDPIEQIRTSQLEQIPPFRPHLEYEQIRTSQLEQIPPFRPHLEHEQIRTSQLDQIPHFRPHLEQLQMKTPTLEQIEQIRTAAWERLQCMAPPHPEFLQQMRVVPRADMFQLMTPALQQPSLAQSKETLGGSQTEDVYLMVTPHLEEVQQPERFAMYGADDEKMGAAQEATCAVLVDLKPPPLEEWKPELTQLERQVQDSLECSVKSEVTDLLEPKIEFITVKLEPLDYEEGESCDAACAPPPPDKLHTALPEPGFSMTVPLKFAKQADKPKAGRGARRRASKPGAVQCDECSQLFKSKKHLKKHMETHRGVERKQYYCECGKTYNSYTGLWKHKRNVHTPGGRRGEQSYACDKCGKWFKGTRYLSVHYLSHTGEKPHVCEYCNKAFRHTSTLNRHTRIHTGIKPYQCDTCQMRFSDSGSLKWHVRKHTGERPYRCAYCENAYAHNTNLRRHLKSHLLGIELKEPRPPPAERKERKPRGERRKRKKKEAAEC